MSDAALSEAPDYEEPQDTEAEAPPPAETAPESPERRDTPQTVPLAVLMKEREAARAAREEAAQLRKQFELGNERLTKLLETVATPQRPPEPMPDINTDPVGYFQRQLAETQRELAEVKGFKNQFEQQGQQTAQEAQFLNAYRMDAMQFSQKAADFTTAYNHFKEAVIRDALESGDDPQEAVAEMESRERRIVQKALAQGRSPAEAIYNAAKRYGFKGGAAPATADAKMDAMQRGQTAARSTAAPGGRNRWDGLTVADLASMTQEEFAKVPDAIVRRLSGG